MKIMLMAIICIAIVLLCLYYIGKKEDKLTKVNTVLVGEDKLTKVNTVLVGLFLVAQVVLATTCILL